MEKIEINNEKLNEIFKSFNENDTIKINKDQLYEYFRMYLNNETNSSQQRMQTPKIDLETNRENKIEKENSEIKLIKEEEDKKEINILKDVEKPNEVNNEEKEKIQMKKNPNIQKNNNDDNDKKKINDIDEMPIGGGFNNFNDMFEKEFLKYQKENNDINNEINSKPKFKYVPKPKKQESLFKVPPKTKKYKYYSDNFKIKPDKKQKKKKSVKNSKKY